jgi:parallel beta-helix repeat protein
MSDFLGTITINADGSITPPTAPISTADNVTYILTGNIASDADGIVIQRSNIVIDGEGYTVQGNHTGTGVYLENIKNATIKDANVQSFWRGIEVNASSNNCIFGNNLTANDQFGIILYSTNLYSWSSNNMISGNNVTANGDGILLAGGSWGNTINGNNIVASDDRGIELLGSPNNIISGNNLAAKYYDIIVSGSNNTVNENNATASNFGIWLSGNSYNSTVSGNNFAANAYGILLNSANCTICGNNVTTNGYGMEITGSSSNTISGNNVTANRYGGIRLVSGGSNNIVSGNMVLANGQYGMELEYSSNNTIFQNNFINNTSQVVERYAIDTWDSGYPSGGNYWSDYTGNDTEKGPYQNITGQDGIGDTPYVIDANNTDNYPLMNPYPIYDIALDNCTSAQTVVYQGCECSVTVKVTNKGDFVESNVTVYANLTDTGNVTAICKFENVTLNVRNSTMLTFMWNTTGFDLGNYTLTAYAEPVPGETEISDNNFTGGCVFISMVGDLTGGSANLWDFVPDGKCDGKDVSVAAKCFGSYPGCSPPLIWNANCDINNDGQVDGRDIATVARHFGEYIA